MRADGILENQDLDCLMKDLINGQEIVLNYLSDEKSRLVSKVLMDEFYRLYKFKQTKNALQKVLFVKRLFCRTNFSNFLKSTK